MTTVSLVMATYNRRQQLAETLATVFAQTRPFDEVIVVDDCSPDGTFAWLKEAQPRVTALQAPRNGGPSIARNLGAAAATGDVLVFFDDDDLLLPGALQLFLDLFAEFPEADAVFTDHEYRHLGADIHHKNHHGTLEMYRRFHRIPTIRSTPTARLFGRPVYKALLRGNLLQQPFAVKRATFLKLGGYAEDIRFCEDWEFYMRLTQAHRVASSDAVASVHVQRGEGANVSLDRRQEPYHRLSLWRRLWAELPRDPASAVVVARRLAGYYKKAGDLAYPTSFWRAWANYVTAFVLWPFDPVVFCGAVLFFLPWILTGRPRKVPDTAVPLFQPLTGGR